MCTHAQVAVGLDFVVLALLWISRDPKVLPGWGAAFTPGHVTDGTAAVQLAQATASQTTAWAGPGLGACACSGAGGEG